jgi:uncharacterized protein involved in exopolysaccharide biosynthesis
MLVYNKSILTGRDFMRALCRRWKLVTTIFVVTVAAASWTALTTPASYRATAKVLLRRDERPTSLTQFYSRLTQEEEIKSELEIASSRPVLLSVLRMMLAADSNLTPLRNNSLQSPNPDVDAMHIATFDTAPSPNGPLTAMQVSGDTLRIGTPDTAPSLNRSQANMQFSGDTLRIGVPDTVTTMQVSHDTLHIGAYDLVPSLRGTLATTEISFDTSHALETLAEEFRRRLTIEAVNGANVIAISFEASDPKRASWCANALANAYTAYNARVYSGAGADEFLSERIQSTRARLDSLENLLEAYRSAHSMISADKQENLLLEKYKSFDLQLAQMLERRQVLTERTAQLRQLETVSEMVEVPTAEMDAHPAVRQLYTKLSELRLQRRALLEKYQPEHHLVIEVSQQLRSVQEELSNEIARLRRLEDERLNALNLEVNALSAVVGSLRTSMQQLPEKERTLGDLEMARDQTRKLYNALVTRKEELGVEKATDRRLSRVAVINPAGMPVEPVSASKARIILLGVVLGLCAGIAAALVREFFDRTIKSPQELHATLDIPVLASISESTPQPNFSPLQNLPSGRLASPSARKFKQLDKRAGFSNGEHKDREQREYFIR